MKPSYPELLRAFVFSCKENPSEEEKEHVSKTIERLKKSEDWPTDVRGSHCDDKGFMRCNECGHPSP